MDKLKETRIRMIKHSIQVCESEIIELKRDLEFAEKKLNEQQKLLVQLSEETEPTKIELPSGKYTQTQLIDLINNCF